MYNYATLASLGDDVFHEPSTHALENHLAQLTGKQAGLFVPSGTMSNQIALRTHLKQPPYSVLCDTRAHINKYISVFPVFQVLMSHQGTKLEV
jgi:threonine aldolase